MWKLPDITLGECAIGRPIDEAEATTYIYSQTKADKLSWSDVGTAGRKLSPHNGHHHHSRWRGAG